MAPSQIVLNSIGTFHSPQVHAYEAGRQPDSFHSDAYIELHPGHNFEQALIGLEGCERIWILFQFHHNEHWNPMVLPPRGSDQKLGVFATRSPYRPNPIGISCVKIQKIEKLKIFVEGADILDGSPIVDIKPYLAYADSFPGVEPEWLKDAEEFTLEVSEQAEEQLRWLEQEGLSQLRSFFQHQLQFDPTNSKKKRVRALDSNNFELAYRTWRIQFQVHNLKVLILHFSSGYSDLDLKNSEDKYADKELHKKFRKRFPSS